MLTWLLLTATLPTAPSSLRVRIWRALKATHCATLREGVYLLPATAASASEFTELEATILQAGATAHLLTLQARDERQQATFEALFDRAAPYREFHQALKAARQTLPTSPEPQLRKTLRTLAQQLQALQASDFFPGADAPAARQGLQALQQDAERRLSPGEPHGAAGPLPALPRLNRQDYQGRVWATRARPWVDRLGTAWLVRRFIDPAATFLWLADARLCPPHALGFDFDGATFTHVGDLVSFEVVAACFGLAPQDPALQRLGALVNAIDVGDVGGRSADEAPGLALMVRGLQALHPQDDDALLHAACPVFDSLHAAFGLSPHDHA